MDDNEVSCGDVEDVWLVESREEVRARVGRRRRDGAVRRILNVFRDACGGGKIVEAKGVPFNR